MVHTICGSGVVPAKIEDVYSFLADYKQYSKLSKYIDSVDELGDGSTRVILKYLSFALQYDCIVDLHPFSKIEITGANYERGDLSYLYSMWELSCIDSSVTNVSYRINYKMHSAFKHAAAACIANSYMAKHDLFKSISSFLINGYQHYS